MPVAAGAASKAEECFVGTREPLHAADAVAALKRELQEELEYTPGAAMEFARFDFDFSPVGQPKVYRIYYEIHVPANAFRQFVLHEGAAFEAIGGRDLLTQRKVTPYDAYAVWMHMSKHRFRQA